ncbi:MAG: glycosyltransferase family 4 protein [Rickettsiales bacterium]|nr:glycosyltransferase family 4 protein [Rickettsiales bacterium]
MTSLIAYTIILCLSAALFSWVATWGLLLILPRLSVIDIPSERSNHASPIPRGAGIAVVSSAVFFLLVSGIDTYLIIALALLAIISFADDRKGQSVYRRLAVHLLASMLAVATIEKPIFQGYLPFMLDHALAVLVLTYFLNIYNFMDGIDELTAVQTVSLSAGLVAMVISVVALPEFLAVDAMVVSGAMLGFWYFNRHPARIFLGDVGSIPLGLIMGYLLLILASQGQWAASLILPAYYLTDASLTLATRLLQGKPIWQSHSEHGYQYAVRRGASHRRVVRAILMLNVVLIALASLSTLSFMAACGAMAAAYLGSLLLVLFLRGSGPVVQRQVIIESHA